MHAPPAALDVLCHHMDVQKHRDGAEHGQAAATLIAGESSETHRRGPAQRSVRARRTESVPSPELATYTPPDLVSTAIAEGFTPTGMVFTT